MDTLMTPELKHVMEQAEDAPVRLTDPDTRQCYVLLRVDQYERLLDAEDQREQVAFLRIAKKNAKARLMEDS